MHALEVFEQVYFSLLNGILDLMCTVTYQHSII